MWKFKASPHWEKFLSTINYNKLTSVQVGEKYTQWLTTIPIKEVPPHYYFDDRGLNWWEKPRRMQFYIPPARPRRRCPYLAFEAWLCRMKLVFRDGFYKNQFQVSKR